MRNDPCPSSPSSRQTRTLSLFLLHITSTMVSFRSLALFACASAVAVSARCHPRRSHHTLSTILHSFEHKISPLVNHIETSLASHNASSEQVFAFVVKDLDLIERHVKKIAKEVHGVAKHHHKRLLTTDSTNGKTSITTTVAQGIASLESLIGTLEQSSVNAFPALGPAIVKFSAAIDPPLTLLLNGLGQITSNSLQGIANALGAGFTTSLGGVAGALGISATPSA